MRYGPQSVADPMMGSGTTRDAIAWFNRTSGHTISYWGGDLRTGFNLIQQDLPGRYDLIWIHPPYWNIIKYSEHEDDLSNAADYAEFCDALTICLLRCRLALNDGGRLAVLVGDVRRKGEYIPIIRDVLNLESRLGQLRSIIIKTQHNCQSDGKVYARMPEPPIQHEYCVVFQAARRPGASLHANRASSGGEGSCS